MDCLKVFTAVQDLRHGPGRPDAIAIAVSEGNMVWVGTLESMQSWRYRVENPCGAISAAGGVPAGGGRRLGRGARHV